MSRQTHMDIAATHAADNLTRPWQSTPQSIPRLVSGLRVNEQILQQADISMFAPADKPPQAVLPLLT